MAMSDKELRELLANATEHAGFAAPWESVENFTANVRDAEGGLLVECFGNKDRFHLARFIAAAPDLATELLESRKELRRLGQQIKLLEAEISARTPGVDF